MTRPLTTLPFAEQRLAAATATVRRLHDEVQQLERNLENARTAFCLKNAELMKAKSRKLQLETAVMRKRIPRIGRGA